MNRIRREWILFAVGVLLSVGLFVVIEPAMDASGEMSDSAVSEISPPPSPKKDFILSIT